MKWTGLGVGMALVALLSSAGVAAKELPVAVSPAGSEGVALVADECPRFSWSGVERARWYELVVYEVGAGGSGESELGLEVLRQRVPGGALSWTPSLDRCLAAGGRYAWAVRARGGKAGGAWSEPALFEVSSEPSVQEVREALEVLERYLSVREHDTEAVAELLAALGDSDQGASEAELEAGESELVSVPRPFTLLPGPSAVAGEETAATGTAFGLVGLTHSIDGGYGVYGENVARGNFGYLGGHDYGVLGRGKTGGGYFKDEDQSGWSIVGFWNDGISAHGNEQGGYFEDTNSTGRAHVAWGEKGIEAWGGTMGGYFKDRETSPRAEAKLAYTKEGTAARYGIWARGSVAGGYFEDGDGGSGYAEIGVSDTGVSGRGNQYGVSGRSDSATGRGGYFSNSAGGTALQAPGTTVIGSVSGSPGNLLVVSGEGTATGGVTSPEVVARFRQTDTTKHSAVSIDSADLGVPADPGQDAILYFSKGGNALWDLRLDDSDRTDWFDTATDCWRRNEKLELRIQQDDPFVPKNSPMLSFEGFRTLPGQEGCTAGIDFARVWVHGHLLPGQDDTFDLGSEDRRWERIWAENGVIQTSDTRLKSAVEEIGHGLDEILELRPVSFQWKDETGRRTHLGLIAQEVEPLIPEAVRRGSTVESPWGMSYDDLIPVLVKAIQERQELLDDLSERVSTLAGAKR